MCVAANRLIVSGTLAVFLLQAVAASAATADLVVTYVGVPPAVLGPGSAFALLDRTKNQGDAAALLSTTRYYLSLDDKRDPGDIKLGSRAIGLLLPGAHSDGEAKLKVPGGTPVGVYHVLVCADVTNRVPEGADEANNCTASLSALRIALPDLSTSLTRELPAAVSPFETVIVEYSVTNSGDGPAPKSSVEFLLSRDEIADELDGALGHRSVPGLGPNQTSSKKLQLPLDTPPGSYYLLVCSDVDENIREENDTNNCSTGSRVLTVVDKLGDWKLCRGGAQCEPVTKSRAKGVTDSPYPPVLLIHGHVLKINLPPQPLVTACESGDSTYWDSFTRELKGADFDTWQLLYDSGAAVADSPWAVREAIDRIIEATGVDKVTLVGHSQGGLVSRAYLEGLQSESDASHASSRVFRLITIGTPHHGVGVSHVPVIREIMEFPPCQSLRDLTRQTDVLVRLNDRSTAEPTPLRAPHTPYVFLAGSIRVNEEYCPEWGIPYDGLVTEISAHARQVYPPNWAAQRTFVGYAHHQVLNDSHYGRCPGAEVQFAVSEADEENVSPRHAILQEVIKWARWGAQPEATVEAFSFEGLGTLPGVTVSARTLSPDGNVIAGGSETGRAYLKLPTGTWQRFGWGDTCDSAISPICSQSPRLSVEALVPGGRIAVGNLAGAGLGVRWTAATAWRGLFHPTSGPCLLGDTAFGIADNGAIIGSDPCDGGFVLVNGVIESLPFDPSGISSEGQFVVGNVTNRGIVFNRDDSSLLDVGWLPGTNVSRLTGVSRDGRVATGWTNIGGERRALRWDASHGLEALEDLSDAPFTSSQPLSVSSDGSIIVGVAASSSGDAAFIWQQGVGIREIRAFIEDRPDLLDGIAGWQIRNAVAVSEDGLTIVGNGVNPGGQLEPWLLRLRTKQPNN